MTEKRFIYKIKNGTMVIVDKKDNVLIRDKYRACDYLNKLNNKNEQLKEKLTDTKELNRIYVDFLVDKGFELFDVIEWSKKELKE